MFEFHDRFRWGEIEVIEGLIFEPADPFSRPFAWVSSMFDYRARLFRADKKDVRATSIKLALNSMESSRKASAAPHGAEFAGACGPRQMARYLIFCACAISLRLRDNLAVQVSFA